MVELTAVLFISADYFSYKIFEIDKTSNLCFINPGVKPSNLQASSSSCQKQETIDVNYLIDFWSLKL